MIEDSKNSQCFVSAPYEPGIVLCILQFCEKGIAITFTFIHVQVCTASTRRSSCSERGSASQNLGSPTTMLPCFCLAPASEQVNPPLHTQ